MRLLAGGLSVLVLMLGMPGSGSAIEADEFDELVGFTVVAATEIVAVHEGKDGNIRARFANGMLFDLDEDATDLQDEAVAVFARSVSADEMLRLGLKAPTGKPFVLYKLLVEDQLIDGFRVH